jgi:hypothetical protein
MRDGVGARGGRGREVRLNWERPRIVRCFYWLGLVGWVHVFIY